MGKFQALSVAQTNELDDLLAVADSILGTKSSVIKGDQKAAVIVGTAIGGAAGAAIAASAGTAGVAAATASVLGGGALAVGGGGIALGVAAIGASPLIIPALIGGSILLIRKNKSKRKEQQKQANYVKEIIEKMEKILNKYEALKQEYERTDKEKEEIIREQKEKLAEYEAIFEALKKKCGDIETNLSFALEVR